MAPGQIGWLIVAVTSLAFGIGIPVVVDLRSGADYFSNRVALTRIVSSVLGYCLAFWSFWNALFPEEAGRALLATTLLLALFQLLGQSWFVHMKRRQIARAWREGRTLPRGVNPLAAEAWVSRSGSIRL
jgi:hypothetical protein